MPDAWRGMRRLRRDRPLTPHGQVFTPRGFEGNNMENYRIPTPQYQQQIYGYVTNLYTIQFPYYHYCYHYHLLVMYTATPRSYGCLLRVTRKR